MEGNIKMLETGKLIKFICSCEGVCMGIIRTPQKNGNYTITPLFGYTKANKPCGDRAKKDNINFCYFHYNSDKLLDVTEEDKEIIFKFIMCGGKFLCKEKYI